MLIWNREAINGKDFSKIYFNVTKSGMVYSSVGNGNIIQSGRIGNAHELLKPVVYFAYILWIQQIRSYLAMFMVNLKRVSIFMKRTHLNMQKYIPYDDNFTD